MAERPAIIVTEKEEVLGCLYNSILRLDALLKEDMAEDEVLKRDMERLIEAFTKLEGNWDFYYRIFKHNDALI